MKGAKINHLTLLFMDGSRFFIFFLTVFIFIAIIGKIIWDVFKDIYRRAPSNKFPFICLTDVSVEA